MGWCNSRSLLLAVIVLSSCITWTASRHHYAHLISYHRSRHRRQGAGLYLPSSYIVPGGKGAGAWGDWGEISPCSRTCGGGVASQKRICLEVRPDGRPSCIGGDTKYFSCNTQDCPPNATDFRTEQCAKYNDVPFRGALYEWMPYTKGLNPCELNCMPRGQRFYYRHQTKVIDGTRCNDESFDVCVNGTCQPAGCDMMLGSNSREDKCRECRGNGSNCETIHGIIDSQDYRDGYSDVLLIPENATNVYIREVKESNNYLALRNQNNVYYLNGDYRIDFPRRIYVAGMNWHYVRNELGRSAPDELRCQGPTTEPLYLSLLRQYPNVGIEYEYSIPKDAARRPEQKYNWAHDNYTECTATCGGGYQTRSVSCRTDDQLEIVEDELCDRSLKPATNQSCNTEACAPEWKTSDWSECSRRCGKGGNRSRKVHCEKIITNGFPSIVSDKECFDQLGPKPALYQSCNENATCPTWFAGPWKPCSKLCGEGKQIRQVVCHQKKENKVELLNDEECEDEKPPSEKTCLLKFCEGVDWVVSDWTGCDTCLSTVKIRTAFCALKDSKVVNESFCAHHLKPVLEEPCDKEQLPPCQTLWYATQWGNCSVECGKGVRSRKVFCGIFNGESVEIVGDELCDKNIRYNETKPCEVPPEKCPAKWYAGPWGECSKECGEGSQSRKVKCLLGDKESTACTGLDLLPSSQDCNTHPCNEDEVIPVNSSSKPIIDDYDDDCEEDYPEVGAEEEILTVSTSPLDMMFSDTSSAEGSGSTSIEYEVESEFSTGMSSETDFFTADSTEGSGTETSVEVSSETTLDETAYETGSTEVTDSSEYDSTSKEASESTYDTSSTETSESETGDTTIKETSESSTDDDTYETHSSEATNTTESESNSTKTDSITTDGTATTDSASTETSSESKSTTISTKGKTPQYRPIPTLLYDVDDVVTTTESGSTDIKVSETTDETETLETEETESSTAMTIDSSGSSEATISGDTLSDIEKSTDSAITKLTDTDKTESTELTATEPTEITVTDITESTVSELTEETETETETETTETTELTVSESTVSELTEETVTDTTETTESTVSEITKLTSETETTESTVSEITKLTSETETTESTVSEITKLTSEKETTESTVSESTVSELTEETVTETAESTVSEITKLTSETETTESTVSEITKLTSETETTETSVSEITKLSSETETTESTVTDITDTLVTESTESTITEKTESTESTISTIYESSETTESNPSETTLFKATETNESPETTVSTVSESTESTASSSSESSTTTESITTAFSLSGSSISDSTDKSTTELPISSETTENSYSVASSEVATESTAASGTSESVTTETSGMTETTEYGSTVSMASDSTTESGWTSPTDSESTTELGFTIPTESESTTELGSTVSTESESTTELGSTIFTASESTTETGSTISTETESTTELSSTASGSTKGSTESTFTEYTEENETSGRTTPWSWSSTVNVYTTKKHCRSRKKQDCSKSKFGCCPDKKTPAKGTFDEGCELVETCEKTKFGCCPDNVSPAQGASNEGCPSMPCNEMLYGCCASDNKTAAEDNDQLGCPPLPPACQATQYGCCEDEETEMLGPNGEGCPIDTTTTEETVPTSTLSSISSSESSTSSSSEPTDTETTETSSSSREATEMSSSSTNAPEGCAAYEFGCCPDNETEATGPNGAGCPCATLEFGCCPDGVTPADATMENCNSCNATVYGCCQDGKSPAHGPDGEGCCLLSAYGCCPDNYRSAEGPHLEGCGCQNSRFGCCPDNETIARGINNEGCGCKYTEFGCCPDGLAEASGPDFEGCTCESYQFGCCDDGVTAAKGPGQQGCRCLETPNGCCEDGVTAAKGANGQGCDCSASKWGCCPDGQTAAQGKKFLGCTDVPESRQAACGLATDQGPCRNYTVHWYFDVNYGGCSRFWYGGCEGNGNKFSSKEECEDVCVLPSPKDACKLPKSKGACDGDHRSWYYDTTREQCTPFVYGGCLGNANKFDTRELCQAHCEPAKSEDQCKLPIDPGSCSGNFGRWGYNSESRDCEQFIWGGCEGNTNRFSTREACLHRCNPPGTLQPECLEPQEAGNCTDKHAMWSFSQTENRCIPFYFTGCGGNENQFKYQELCTITCPSTQVQDECHLPASTGDCADYTLKWFYDTLIKRCRQFYYGGCGGNNNKFDTEEECEGKCSEKTTTTTTSTTTTTVATPIPAVTKAPFEQEICFLERDAGPCTAEEQRWAYDAGAGRCAPFTYSGCGGNRNNFPSEDHCNSYCHPSQDVCQLPMRTGACGDSYMKWFYDASTDSCSQFTYSGCDGNDNKFDTLEDCERRCKTGPPVPEVPLQCQISASLEECTEPNTVWYLDAEKRECVPFINVKSGLRCRNTGVFSLREECEDICAEFSGLIIHNTLDACQQTPDPGTCSGYQVQWYYDESRDVCHQFVYTGCGGNDNKFESREECEGRCKKSPPITTTTTTATAKTTSTTSAPHLRPDQDLGKECRTPSSLEPCGRNVTAYYYNEATRACTAGVIGACAIHNNYRSEEECLRRCGQFKGLEVCRYALDPGFCHAAIPKFYWDSKSGSCLPYAYGGCSGSPNRFSTVEECEEVCKSTGPAAACLHAVAEGTTRCGRPVRRWHYSTVAGECRAFIYQGCDGNENNFASPHQCQLLCETYKAHENNTVEPDCSAYESACAALRCEFGVQRARTASGCERCSCVQPEVDCTQLTKDCEQLKCNYGLKKTVGADGCERCSCLNHPCTGKYCPEGERCVPNPYYDGVNNEVHYSVDCRVVNKPGACPAEANGAGGGSCRRDCNDDADCRGVGKCCRSGCSQLCLLPQDTTTPPITTIAPPNIPQAPTVNKETEPEIAAQEGGKASLRCLFHSNPPPKITWRRGEVVIDGDKDRYRLLSDGTLEIVALYRSDAGVYICVADNGLGIAEQQINLIVKDPVQSPASIAGDQDAVVEAEMGRSVMLRCFAYGFPPPQVAWYRGLHGPMVPFSSKQYEARDNWLLVRELNAETLGEYACEAYNGVGNSVSWRVMLRARIPQSNAVVHPPVPDQMLVTRPPRVPAPLPFTTLPPLPETPAPDNQVPPYTVPVSTSLTAERTTLGVGSELSLRCDVDGYPVPSVRWTKDGNALVATERMHLTDARLRLADVYEQDSGTYGCHARNEYSSHYSTIQITVQAPAAFVGDSGALRAGKRSLHIPAYCTDNPLFANCVLIVRSKFCTHKYYSSFCCKSCAEAGQLDPRELQLQADTPWRK